MTSDTQSYEDRLAYEDKLGDALEKLLSEGAASLEQLADGLNKIGPLPGGDAAWTPDSLQRELARLAA
ncbi:hypothetical protein PY365_01880 [Roseiarcaceae bacterium H3SJ34-1]|uniref:recombinase-like helix-turn-helix domain-containing protein n=1 Tax=Terripilifer ovatus TaxID=3032367 RepID=UPI003AB9690E|nr:hypothetical protein [Roseiarcaceae bacterium H3SJ34-1]